MGALIILQLGVRLKKPVIAHGCGKAGKLFLGTVGGRVVKIKDIFPAACDQACSGVIDGAVIIRQDGVHIGHDQRCV